MDCPSLPSPNHPELKGKTALECLKGGQEEAVIGTARAIAQGSFA